MSNHAVLSLAALIPYTIDPALPAIVRIALLEAWFNNHRLLIEFFTINVKNTARATDFVESWAPPSSAKATLTREYGAASQSVTHIGGFISSEWGEVDPPELRAKARLLLTVLESFVDALDAEDHLYAPIFGRVLRDARKALAAQV